MNAVGINKKFLNRILRKLFASFPQGKVRCLSARGHSDSLFTHLKTKKILNFKKVIMEIYFNRQINRASRST